MKLKENIAISESGFIDDPTKGEALSVNETGKFILDLLKEEISEEDIVSHIILEYDISGDMAERYAKDFLSTIKEYEII